MEGYLGEIRLFGGTWAPRGWATCSGQLLSISEYDALYALLGTTYGGDGMTSFALPNLQSRRPVNPGIAPGTNLNFSLGEVAGKESTTMLSSQMPMHTHTLTATVTISNCSIPAANNDATPGIGPQNAYYAIAEENIYAPPPGDAAFASFSGQVGMTGMGTSVAGASQPIETITPYIALNYIICIQGIFPSRN